MSPMLILLFALLAGALSGALAGVAVQWLLTRWRSRLRPVDPVVVDPGLKAALDRAASAWASAHGRPEASRLVANKLRLVYGVNQRRAMRRRRWWR